MNKYTFFVYILRCCDGSYYTGMAGNIEWRIAEHYQGNGCDYTAKRLPLKLVWVESFGTKGEALEAERKIKNWSQKKKKALISGNWEEVRKNAKKKF